MVRVKGRPWRRRFRNRIPYTLICILTFTLFPNVIFGQENNGGGYDGYEDPEVDEFDSVRIVYGDNDYNRVLPLTGPCSDYKPGEDDLQAFDFIRKFRLDILEGEVSTITRVRGSDRLQTAYKLDRQIDLTRDTREIFPQGLPEQFSFITTWRTRKPPKVPWNIISISDYQNRTQFAISLNPRSETVEFSILDYEKNLQTLVFRNVEVFDRNWHKLHFGVFRDRVLLYADCEEIGSEALEVRSTIPANGKISLAKLTGGSGETVPIDLQWMVLNCDPTKPERETCDELPPKKIVDPPPTPAPTRPVPIEPPPPGPPGPKGDRGDRGDRGFPGVQGPPGEPGLVIEGGRPIIGPPGPPGPRGSEGFRGEQGEKGDRGEPGFRGEIGPKGEHGRGEPGMPGLNGIPGLKGDSGEPGERGPPGAPGSGSGGSGMGMPGDRGPAGLPGPPGYPGERGASGERGPPGPSGLPGIPGSGGPPGQAGMNGQRGTPGINGLPGPPGRTYSENELRDICASVLRDQLAELTAKLSGPIGQPGNSGKPGQRGESGPPGERDRMEELTRNLIGPPGRPGLVGRTGIRGVAGAQGLPGDPGRQGQEGPRGFSGLPGVPGPRGPEGQKGERGEIGIPGPEGFGLEGPAGPPGVQGPQGPPGVGLTGRPGERGPSGPRGSPGKNGQQGPQGPPGYCEFCNYPGGMAHGPFNSGGTKKGPPSGGKKGK